MTTPLLRCPDCNYRASDTPRGRAALAAHVADGVHRDMRTTAVELTPSEAMSLCRLARGAIRKAERGRKNQPFEPESGHMHSADILVANYTELLDKLLAAAPAGFDPNDGGRDGRES